MRSNLARLAAFVVVVVSFSPITYAVDTQLCRVNILEEWSIWNSSASSNVTSYPSTWEGCLDSSTVVNGILHLTYPQCICKCGGGPGDFQWALFSPSFSAWLLPWFALTFQLPFGSDTRFVNVMSVLLTIGSPCLAGYSLAITRLNNLWLTGEFNEMSKYHNIEHVPTVLTTLQHVPIKFPNDFASLASLIVLPENNGWWEHMAKMSKKTRQWNIPTAMNVIWVVIAFVLTLIDSFSNFGSFLTVSGDTVYAILAIWSYMVPLVIGWLQVGSQPEPGHLRLALKDANSKFYVQTESRPTLASEIKGHHGNAIEHGKYDTQYFKGDERKSAPIFNYSRVFIWSRQANFLRLLYRNASEKAGKRIPVDGGDWNIVDPSRNEIGSLNQVVEYCLGDNTDPHIDIPQAPSSTTAVENCMDLPLWAPRVIVRALIAAILGLGLQWGIIGAAIMMQYQTPPQGLGCRTLTYTIYGSLATIVFLSMFFSSILSHCARDRPHSRGRATLTISASVLRWLGKYLGALNALGFVTACLMQLSGAYDNCFCSSTNFAGIIRGMVTILDQNAAPVYKYCIGGTVMAVSANLLYSASIYFASPMFG